MKRHGDTVDHGHQILVLRASSELGPWSAQQFTNTRSKSLFAISPCGPTRRLATHGLRDVRLLKDGGTSQKASVELIELFRNDFWAKPTARANLPPVCPAAESIITSKYASLTMTFAIFPGFIVPQARF
jgi:hypothetical protein